MDNAFPHDVMVDGGKEYFGSGRDGRTDCTRSTSVPGDSAQQTRRLTEVYHEVGSGPYSKESAS